MKKMRKLIPAFAMLLVSAIMMSTASFAWFTMNDNVTATGMQVQAKAAGNLLISTEKLSAADKGISVDFSDRAKVALKPITYKGNGAWETVGGGTTVDPTYGTASGTMQPVTPAAAPGEYFAHYRVFLATAGDAFTGEVTFTIDPIGGADEDIAPAYTVVVFVAKADGTIDYTTPTGSFNYESRKAGTTTTVSLGSQAIPSTYGRTANDRVGLEVVIRIYVDGALPCADTVVETRSYVDTAGILTAAATAYTEITDDKGQATGGYNFTNINSTYDAALKSLLDAGKVKLYSKQAVLDKDGKPTDTYTYTVIDHSKWTVGETKLAEQGVGAIWDGVTVTTENVKTMYVNNANVPVGGTTFAVEFTATNPNQ